MSKYKRIAKITAVHTKNGVRTASSHVARGSKKTIIVAKKTAVVSGRVAIIGAKHAGKQAKRVHYHVATRPHEFLHQRYGWYRQWHTWRWHKVVHHATLGVYIALVGLMVFNSFKFVLAADLSNTWDFSTPSNFSLDSGIETSGSNARLKAQEYSSDANTAALYHLNESSGTSVTDSSSNANTGTANTAPTWGAGNLNNGATLNGTSQQISAADSASLSPTGQHSLEGWIKPSSTFNTSANNSMGILDKGSYKVSLDRTSGKLAYEAKNASAGDAWSRKLGNGLNGSWTHGHVGLGAAVAYGSDIYVTSSQQYAGDGEVWKWNGTTWTMIGGDGINGSWADQTYEEAPTMTINGNALYVGLGITAGDGEVWTCDLATSCASWSKIGGDGNGPSAGVEGIYSMTVHSGSLYIGGGTGLTDSNVWKYNGSSSWTQVAGGGTNSSWNSGYESVNSLASDGTYLYAGLGNTVNDAEVWRYNGTTWTQIGGDGLSSSWNTNFEYVRSMVSDGTNLYAGLGLGSGDGLIYKWNGTVWSQIGGSGLNSSWVGGGQASEITSMVWDGTNLYAGLLNSGAGLWRYNGTTWTQIGGGSVNGSWSTSVASPIVIANSKVYSGAYSTNTGPSFWEWTGSGNWTQIGGRYINNSFGGFNIGTTQSSAVANGKVYYGTGLTDAQVYEYDGTTARRIGGSGLNSSWAANTYENVFSMIAYNGYLYVGLGTNGGDGELWRWDGSTWTKAAGDGVNSSWTGHDTVSSLVVQGGSLYVGLGNAQSGTSDIWRYNGSSWSQIGGDGLNSGWLGTAARNISSMATYNNQLYVGLEIISSPGVGNLWMWNGTVWTQVGGGSNINSGWSSATSDAVSALSVYDGMLYAGVSEINALNSAVWQWNGSSWTKVAGASVNGSWTDGTYSRIPSMAIYNGELYVGTGASLAGSGDVWRYNGTAWSQIAGDGLNSAWAANTIESVLNLTAYKGKLYAATGSTPNADANVWSMGNNTYLESTTSSFSNNWYHFAVTGGNGTTKLYINGTEEASGASATISDNSLALHIGSNYGSEYPGEAQGYFAGSLDEIRISNTARSSFITKPYSNSEQGIVLADAVRKSGVNDWESFASSETTNGGTITYRLSDDEGDTWKYWDGAAWSASSGLTQANSVGTVTGNIGSFPVTFNGIKWQAILKGDGTQQVTLNSVELGANSDAVGPDTNATNITALKANGGAVLNSNQWTNGASPYFSWTAGSDSGAGILGYCLYLGNTPSADPISTKGLLGTSPVDTAGNCQFAVSGTNIDLATAGYLGTALASSNTPYYLNIKAIDNAGNLASASEQFQFRFDNTAPTNPGFVSAPSGFINTKTATLTWPTSGGQAASDANSGIAGLQYRIGNTTWYGDDHTGTGDVNDILANDGSYTTVDPPDFDNITDGVNTVAFRTWDQAGNYTTNYVSAALRVNTSGAPSEPQNLTATPSTNTTNSFAFDWQAPTTFNTTTGNADKLSYCYTVNTQPTVNNCNFTGAGTTSLNAAAYATQPGANTFYVVAKDDFGAINYSSYTSTTFTANTAAPGMPSNIAVADVSVKTTSNWRLAVTWDEPSTVGAGVNAYKVYRSTDNVSFSQVGTSSSTSYVDSNLSQTTYYYKVKACDSANNCGAESGVVFEIPTGKFTTSANATSEPVVTDMTTKRATISWSTDRASDSKVAIGTASGEYSPSEVGNSAQVTAHTIDLDNLAAGTTYYFKAKWTDEDGNTGTSQEYTFQTAPAPVLKEVNTLSIGLSNATVEFTTKDSVKVDLNFGRDDSFGGVKSINTSSKESTYAMDITGLEDGTKYFYRLAMYDSEGGKYTSSIFSFTTPPRPKISDLRFQPVSGEPTSTQRVTWKTNVATNSILDYGKLSSTGTTVQTTELKTEHEVTVRSLEDESEYFLLAQGRDVNGNLAVSDRQVFKTALDTRPPSISDIVIEPTVRGSGAEARGQIVVSWTTDEPSTSQVAFGEGSNVKIFNNRTAEDGQLTNEHLVIVSDLPPSKVYSIAPVSKDKAGNSTLATSQTAIIGRASESILNLVLNTLKKAFGL